MAGVPIANRIEFKRARVDSGSTSANSSSGGNNGASGFEATGTISNFVSVASFTVAGVSVDASTATFKDGSVADLRNAALRSKSRER